MSDENRSAVTTTGYGPSTIKAVQWSKRHTTDWTTATVNHRPPPVAVAFLVAMINLAYRLIEGAPAGSAVAGPRELITRCESCSSVGAGRPQGMAIR